MDSEMNERIKALWNEAAESTAAFPSGQNNSWETQVNFIEKFAELILQDIDKIVDDLYHSMPLEQAAVLLTLDENIKEHFYGVEE